MLRPCLDCGEPTPKTRCPEHTALRESFRPSRRVMGRYDTRYLRLRRAKLAQQPWCSECHAPHTESNPLQVDHRVPLAKGGRNVLSNLDVLCRYHNAAKRDKIMEASR